MKIVVDARKISHSTGTYVHRLLEHLQSLDIVNNYAVVVKPDEADFWQPQHGNFQIQPVAAPEYTFTEQVRLLSELKKLQPDLVHFTMPQHPLLYRGPFVVTIHDLTLLSFTNAKDGDLVTRAYKNLVKPLVFKLVMRHAVTKSAHIFVPTQFVKNELTARYRVDPAKISVTYEAVDKLAAKAEPWPSLKDKQYLLYVGNAYPYKNLQRLVDAFGIVHAKNPDLHLVLVGSTFYEDLQAYVRQTKAPNIIFTGFVDTGKLAWLYQHAQALAFPSLSEGFGLPGLEAMQYGLPVVSSNATCLPEVYGDAALYFDPENTEDMAAKIGKVIKDPKLRAQLKKKGLAQVKKYSWRTMAGATLKIYNSLLPN